MKIEKILTRIGLDESEIYEANIDNLKLLMNQYLLNVPYENLDFHYKKEFNSNILKIYEKIVNDNRGGVCYESNTLFCYLLKTLGFDVQMILAHIEDTTYVGSKYPHLTLLVNINNIDYLVDVANAQSFRNPLPIKDETVINETSENKYKVRTDGNVYILLKSHKNKAWIARYSFTKDPIKVSDFVDIFEGEEYLTFAKKAPLLVTKALGNGRATLTDNMMTIKEDGKRRTWNISEENRAEVLRDYFDIKLDFTYKL